MNTRRVLLVVVVVAILLGLAAAYFLLTPRLADFSPADGDQDLPAKTSIMLNFTRPMDRDSVQANLSIEPQIAGTFTWEGNTLIFTPEEGWSPGTTVTVQLSQEGRSMLGLPLSGDTEWAFSISNVLLAYLYPAGAPASIYTLDLQTGQKTRLPTAEGVIDFSVAADGSGLYYSLASEQGGSQLLWYDRLTTESQRLLTCVNALCANPRPSPDSVYLAYERTPLSGIPQVWLLDIASLTAFQISADGHQAQLPQWASAGLLSYYDADEQAYILYALDGSPPAVIPNQTGEAGSWSPDGMIFVAPELFTISLGILRGPSGEAGLTEVPPDELEPVEVLSSHLLLTELASGTVTDLTSANNLEDSSPVFSPDGAWIAFSRRSIDPENWIPGRQLWVMRADGSTARQLTNSPDYKYTAFAWRPDDALLAYVRFNQMLLTEPLEIWTINADGSDPLRVVVGGFSPQWIP